MVKYTVHQSVCPHCGTRLRYQGRKQFGAPEALCGRCGKKIDTGLTEWANLSGGAKAWAATIEILLPSFYSMKGFDLVVIGGIVFQTLLMALTFCTLPFILAWRLTRLIAESNAYTNSGVLPVIKRSGATKALDADGYGGVRSVLKAEDKLDPMTAQWGLAVDQLREWREDYPAVFEQLLLRALTDGDRVVRSSAADHLSDCTGPDVVPALQRALADPAPAVKQSAAAALKRIEAKSTQPEASTSPSAPQPVATPAAAPAPAAAPVPAPAAPAPAAAVAAQSDPSHVVPAGGVAGYATPGASSPPTTMLAERAKLSVVGRDGIWAQVRDADGWTGWVDGRLLVELR